MGAFGSLWLARGGENFVIPAEPAPECFCRGFLAGIHKTGCPTKTFGHDRERHFQVKKAGFQSIFIIFCVIGLLVSGCSKTSNQPAEAPEDVVKKFYAYIKEGGPTTLGEAYKLCSTKHYVQPEDRFRDTVSKFSKDMKVNVLGSKIMKDKAVVKIECKVPSVFGGDFVQESDINLDLDEKTNSWKIDFTGETLTSDQGSGVSKTVPGGN